MLLMHDCIIIPKFGGFVLQTIPASYDKQKNQFSPLRKEVVFNSTLQYNDGLLSESYMKSYGVDYRKAQLMLDEDVQSLKAVLQQEGNVSLGNLGSFSLEEEGQILFRSNDVQTFSMDSYGLSAFYFPPLSSLPKTSARPNAQVDMPALPKEPASASIWSWGWGRVAIASAAAVALFLLVSTPVKEVNQSAYTASFVPTKMVVNNKKAVTEMVPVEKKEEVKVIAEATVPAEKRVESKAKAPIEKPVVAESKAKTPVKQEQPVAKPTAKKSGKTYYIVIASFPTESQADQFLAGVDRKVCRNANKISNGNKYRIYADKYMSRAEAESYMKQLRNHPKYKDAWLFITR